MRSVSEKLRLAVAPLALTVALGLASGCATVRAAAGEPSSLADVLSGLIWPLRFDGAGNVRSRYGYRGWGGGAGRYHYGLDLQARRGDPVYSVAAGTVAATGEGGAYGRHARVDHGHELSSFYAHLERVLVRSGEPVRRGQVLGLAGATGNATGTHLHFELRWGSRWVDPWAVLPRLR
ncbi:MAG: M23 family metallopeptidase [Gemmatimonadota bacterium]